MRNELAAPIAGLGLVILASVWAAVASAGTVDASRLLHVADTAAKPAAENAASAAPTQLEAEEVSMSDLPMPANHAAYDSSAGPYRRDLYTSVPADVASVLAFYRRELDKRSWKEQPGAVVSAEAATIAFVSPKGPAMLKLAAQDGGTSVSLVALDRAEAEKDGLAPKQGQAKVEFSNASHGDAVFSVNEQTVKIAAWPRETARELRTIDLPPGKYKIVVEIVGSPAQSVETTVGADETWDLSVSLLRLQLEHIY
ncbi:hypothetical protein [Labrys wisconsinensis]|uniref:DUF4397 domain-containing protein n=1 Tax=Labrys wisconsinensis TaxID=425677 RepID=A0ABU0JLS3_9HYPH|nr:hypothetical protein [Labrys wisconsinensis]MDQ0474194.1 hypothetical protein [Labrys wisconsinensis]